MPSLFYNSIKIKWSSVEKLRKHIGLRHYEEDEELLEDVIIENNLNQVMKFLAAITIILELPTMISGLYGMNVNGVGMLFATKAYGFAAISIFSLIVCLIAVYILKKKHIL